jgi:hypothetical protein
MNRSDALFFSSNEPPEPPKTEPAKEHWIYSYLNKKITITAFLFLIGTLHTMVYAFVQFPGTFIAADLDQDPLLFKVILYGFTVGVSCFHQPIARKLGLKNVLMLGLFGNAIALMLLFFHHYVEHPKYHFALYLSMMFMGSSMLSVINSLVTYVILEFPTKTVTAITALFAFLNGGIMVTPILLTAAQNLQLTWSVFFIIIGMLLLAVGAVWLLFFEPVYPKHYEHLRSGTLVWKEMHQRLGLYILSIFLYSLVESTFSLWGNVHLLSFVSFSVAENAASVFWVMMILGQLLLMIPLYYFEPRKVFYVLVPFVLFALIYTPLQTKLSTITFGLGLGGFSCAAIYPIILALLEMEIIHASLISHEGHYLPLIDTAVSFLMAGYLLGSSVIDFWIYFLPKATAPPHFHLAIVFLAVITFLMFYLDWTRKPLMGIKGTFLKRD